MLLGAEEVGVAEVSRADFRQHLAARGDGLRLERLGMRAGKNLARDDAFDEALHRNRRDQRKQALRVDRRIDRAGVRPRLESVEGVPHPELDLLHGDPRGCAQFDC